MRQGEAVVFTLAHEPHSLDPFAVMVVYGSARARANLQEVFGQGEASDPPQDRRSPIQRHYREAAEASGLQLFDFGGLDGGHNIVALKPKGRA
jgi:hypothetical protein